MYGTKRDLRFEALRIVAMYLILCCHFVAFMPWELKRLAGFRGLIAVFADKVLGQMGVSLFFFIPGWFHGNRRMFSNDVFPRSVKRGLLKVITQTWLYSWFILFALFLYRVVWNATDFNMLFIDDEGRKTLFESLFPISSGTFWFISSYIVVLMLSPVLSYVMANSENHDRLLCVLVFLSFTHIFTRGMRFFNNVVYAVMLYVWGGWLSKKMPTLMKLHPLALFLLSLGSAGAIAFFIVSYSMGLPWALYLGWNESYLYGLVPPATTVLASILLLIFIKYWDANPLPERFRRPILALSSSTFGVYILHFHPAIRTILWSTLGSAFPRPTSLMGIFVLSVLLSLVLFATLLTMAYVFDSLVVRPVHRVVLGHFFGD